MMQDYGLRGDRMLGARSLNDVKIGEVTGIFEAKLSNCSLDTNPYRLSFLRVTI